MNALPEIMIKSCTSVILKLMKYVEVPNIRYKLGWHLNSLDALINIGLIAISVFKKLETRTSGTLTQGIQRCSL